MKNLVFFHAYDATEFNSRVEVLVNRGFRIAWVHVRELGEGRFLYHAKVTRSRLRYAFSLLKAVLELANGVPTGAHEPATASPN